MTRMSDVKSAPPSPESKKKNDITGSRQVYINTALQKALLQLQTEERSKVILRCDDLPIIPGAEEDFEKIFFVLLHLIFHKKNDVPQLFLHIHCLQEENSSLAANEEKWFTIQFKTNITPDVEWLETNNHRINEVAAILQKNKGTLVVSQLKSSGCIFSVSLPGKI